MTKDVSDAAQFLLDRLHDLEAGWEDEHADREFCGHVSPAMARLSAALRSNLKEQPVAWIDRLLLAGMQKPSVSALTGRVYNAKVDDNHVPLYASPSYPVSRAVVWHDIEYLMSIIDSAIEDGFDPDEDGPVLDHIRDEVKAGLHRLSLTDKPVVAWLLNHPVHGERLSLTPITDGDRSLGWVDTPLCTSITDKGEVGNADQ